MNDHRFIFPHVFIASGTQLVIGGTLENRTDAAPGFMGHTGGAIIILKYICTHTL